MSVILNELMDFKIRAKAWEIVDLRINLPVLGPGSDAINSHTQYSNPVAFFNSEGITGIGAGFTLGRGNDFICKGIEELLKLWDGYSLRELAASKGTSPYDILVNPTQIRWLSPNSGVAYQAAGVIVNTLLDFLAKRQGLPAWEALCFVSKDEFEMFFGNLANLSWVDGLAYRERPEYPLDKSPLTAYHTTWIGTSAKNLAEEICNAYRERSITVFKVKIGRDVSSFISKIDEIKSLIPTEIVLAADANQTMTLDDAKAFIKDAASRGVKWLEEPFAPDNVEAFRELIRFRDDNSISIEIVTGENCPSPHVAAGFMASGIDRFQADPCRMLGMVDVILVSLLAQRFDTEVTPHAGGSCLDELSAHIIYYDRNMRDLNVSNGLIENVGFCSKFMKSPVIVEGGRITAPSSPGLLVGFSEQVVAKFKNYKDGITWLEP